MKSLARFTKPLDNGGVIGPTQSYPGSGIWKLGTEPSATLTAPTVQWSLDLTSDITTDVATTASQFSNMEYGDMLLFFTAGGFGDPGPSADSPHVCNVIHEDGNSGNSERIQYYFWNTGNVSFTADLNFRTGNSQWRGIVLCIRGVDEYAFRSTLGTSTSGSHTMALIDDTSLFSEASSISTSVSNSTIIGCSIVTNATDTYTTTAASGTYQDQYQFNNGQPRSMAIGYIEDAAPNTSHTITFNKTGGGTQDAGFYVVLPPLDTSQSKTFSNSTFWNNVSVTGIAIADTNELELTGHQQRITLKGYFTETSGSCDPRVYVKIGGNNSSTWVTPFTSNSGTATLTWNVGVDDIVWFRITGGSSGTGAATIYNLTDDPTESSPIDTFTYSYSL